jgi:hypothetical protein
MTDVEEALWPGGVNAVETVLAASRADLTGKRIGFLWDDMFRGEEIFPILQRNISKRFDDVTFVGYGDFGPIFGGNEHAVVAALPERLEALGIDAVISGIGC